MSIFDAYDTEFSSINREINKNIQDLKSSASGESSTSLVTTIDGLFSQLNDLIKQIEIEVRSQDAATRKVLNEKLQQYKKTSLSLKSDFEKAKEKFNRSELVGAKSVEQRQRLLDTNDK